MAETMNQAQPQTTVVEGAPADNKPTRVLPKPSEMQVRSGGLELNTLEDVVRMAQYILKSGFAPKGMQTVEALVVAIECGKEVGLPTMSAVQNIAVINGRPTIFGDAVLGICMSSPRFDHGAFSETIEGDGDNMRAVCRVRRVGVNTPVIQTFSVADAKRAKLWGKQGPWSEYPTRMLMWRARTFALRNAFADILKGYYTTEEARDIAVDRLVESIDLPDAPAHTTPKPTKGPVSPSTSDQAASDTAPANSETPPPANGNGFDRAAAVKRIEGLLRMTYPASKSMAAAVEKTLMGDKWAETLTAETADFAVAALGRFKEVCNAEGKPKEPEQAIELMKFCMKECAA